MPGAKFAKFEGFVHDNGGFRNKNIALGDKLVRIFH
jgi:hypothetical protein